MRAVATFRRFAAAAALAAALMALAACSVNPATGKQTFTAFMSREDELRVGAEEHPKILRQYGGAYGEGGMDAYVQDIGRRLALVSEASDLAFRFTVLNTDDFNAFALPGGYVYVTRGLLALADNEAEVAGVLAHEIGHVVARHTAQRVSQANLANIGLLAVGVLGSAAGLPSDLGQVASLGAQGWLSSFSREQELESDMLAVRYMTRAGYHPEAMTSFFRKLEGRTRLEALMRGEPEGAADGYGFLSSHPRTTERIVQAIQLADATPVANPRFGRDDLLAHLDGLVYGDDPKQGVRRGREFRHPDFRFAFTVPEGFRLINTPNRVIARRSDGPIILFDMEGSKKAEAVRDMASYVAQQWGANLGLANVERIEVAGLEAVTGKSRVQTKNGPRDVRLIAIRGRADEIFRFAFLTPPALTARLSTELQRTTYSFRRLSETEAKAIQPLRIRIVAVAPGDTVEKLAERMDLDGHRLEWFELLNDVRRGQALVPGVKVKIVGG